MTDFDKSLPIHVILVQKIQIKSVMGLVVVGMR